MVSNYELSRALEKLIKNVQILEAKVDLLPKVLSSQLVENLKTLSFRATNSPASTVTLSVAEHKTLEVLKSLAGQEVTAEEIAFVTKRARAVESMYLNGLHRRGLVLKHRIGRKVVFLFEEEHLAKG